LCIRPEWCENSVKAVSHKARPKAAELIFFT